jgi:hypothetical protein
MPADVPSVGIGGATVTEGNAGSASVTFTVTLSAAYGQPVFVHYATADGTATAGSDYAAASGDLTIPAGQTTRTVTITVLADRLPEPNETFAVNPSGVTKGFLADAVAIGTVRDDEPRVAINDVTLQEGNSKSGVTLSTFTVRLSAAYDQAVTVSYSTADGKANVSDNDYLAASGTLTFAPGETAKTVAVSPDPGSTRDRGL